MNSVYKSMRAHGNLVSRVTNRLLLQDLAYMTGPFQGEAARALAIASRHPTHLPSPILSTLCDLRLGVDRLHSLFI